MKQCSFILKIENTAKGKLLLYYYIEEQKANVFGVEELRKEKCAEPYIYTLPKNKAKKLEKKSKKGVDFRGKCGIINKLSRKTAALKSQIKAMHQQKRSGKPNSVRVESF